MSIKVKTFTGCIHGSDAIGNQIQRWLEENEHIEIVSSSQSDYNGRITAIVFYKEKYIKTRDLGVKMDDKDFVNFGDVVARGKFGMQCQYVSRYVDGVIPGWANLGKGLRFQGSAANYHSLKIHKDDVEEFVRRVKKHWAK